MEACIRGTGLIGALLILAALVLILGPVFLVGFILGHDRGIRDATQRGHW